MKRRRIEFLFVLILAISLYIVFSSDYGFGMKVFFSMIYGVIIFITIFSLMLENRSAQATLLWMYVLLFIPVLGYLFYLYSGQLYLKGYLFYNKRKNDREEWESVVRKNPSPDLSSFQDNQLNFAKFAEKVSFTKMNTNSKTTILRNGEETFTDIKNQLLKAEKYIHLEYYIFRSDRLGKEIIKILIEKANAGIEVLFIFDAAGSIQLSNEDIKSMQASGIKIHPFLPLKYGFFNQKFNFRNHRKIIIIDGKVGFVGGLNVGIEYIGEDPKFGFWRDTHMRLEGQAVYTLHTVFLLDWEYVSGQRLLEEHPPMNSEKNDIEDGTVQVVASGPDTLQGIMSDLYYVMMSSAKQSIWIATPYFVPNEAIRTALRIAASKGIEVRIMVPEQNDGFLTQYATRSYFAELLRCGVEIYSYKKGFMHQKIIIIDGNLASLGTANMDMRSFHLNFEVNVFMVGTSSIRDLVSHYEDDMKDSVRIMPVEYYKRGLINRTKESFARLFSGVL
ncbi:cardiolipin synthase [Falsibacillus albus]|uniref:Cardiolipin synthase n=1 Tax=Falsibacillus albus TaxID=2478915 RepID=A0A3L7K1M5_9BACI|nr:cardiolipin synthase [Falsibacillus albus]RLQ96254.1 cardiolipin synthase [Falsibacillus albus]